MLALSNPSRLSFAIFSVRRLGGEPLDDETVRRQPLLDADDLLRQRRRTIDVQCEEIGARLVADHEQVFEPGGGEVDRPRPASLEQGVGSAGGRQAASPPAAARRRGGCR